MRSGITVRPPVCHHTGARVTRPVSRSQISGTPRTGTETVPPVGDGARRPTTGGSLTLRPRGVRGDLPKHSRDPDPLVDKAVEQHALLQRGHWRAPAIQELQAAVVASASNIASYDECNAALGGKNVIGFVGPAAGATIQLPSSIITGDLPFVWGDLTLLGPITIGHGESTRLRWQG